MIDWRKDIWAALAGSDPRDMKIYMGGRQIGKSVMAQMWNIMHEDVKCEVVAKQLVDDTQFYTVRCNKEIADWVRRQPNENSQWYEHIDHNWMVNRMMFDVSEDFYLILRLTWPQ